MSLSGLKNRNGGKGKKGQAGKAGGEPLAPAAWVGATISVAPAAPLFLFSHFRAKALGLEPSRSMKQIYTYSIRGE